MHFGKPVFYLTKLLPVGGKHAYYWDNPDYMKETLLKA
jgi:hypothetical protein